MNTASSLRPKRKITGVSAVLLPFGRDGEVDWDAFSAHVARTADAGLAPAVNMDTGFVNLIDEETQRRVLRETRKAQPRGNFYAGAFVRDRPSDPFHLADYLRQSDRIHEQGGTPIIFPSHGLTVGGRREIVGRYADIAAGCPQFVAFELSPVFAPVGHIHDLDTFRDLMALPGCVGLKHSSLQRELEWQRLALRDRERPDFHVFTGNDLAIDMVMYGSDYLLGLSTMAPVEFALRDDYWEAGDARFYELNDALQYLGAFTFRPPVPAYKHSAAQVMRLRGWIDSDRTHCESPCRPESDLPVLREILARLEALVR